MDRSKVLRPCEASSGLVSDYSRVLETFSDPTLDPEATPVIAENHNEASLKMFISGGVAGAASKTFTAPFARLTILYQTHGFASLGHTPRLDTAFEHVIKTEGMRSLWKGNLATILHRIPYSAASFLIYEESLAALQVVLPKEQGTVSGKVDVLRRLVAGALAGSCSTTLAYPIDLVRTRLAAQTSFYYKGIWDVLRRTYIEERVLGLYKGLGGSLIQVVPNVSVNLSAYETLRSHWLARHPDQTSPDLLGSVICGGTSGLISSTITYPIDLIRRRMQLQGQGGAPRTYTSYSDAINKTWRSGGLRSFFVGITAEYMKVVPGVAMIYAFYEMSKRTLGVDRYNRERVTMDSITTETISEPDGNDGNKCTEPGKAGRSFEATMRQYPCAKMKLDQFFLEWLSLPEYERLITKVLENAVNNRPLKRGVEEAMSSQASEGGMYSASLITPPLSPKASAQDPKSEESSYFLNKSKSVTDGMFSDHHHRSTPIGASVPQFYFPEGSPTALELKKSSHQKISELFGPFQPMGMQQKEFLKVLVEVCELPEMLAYPLFRRLTDNSLLTQEVFESWWDSESLASASIHYRMVCILHRDSSVQWLSREDFIPLLRSIVDYHPSLEFLSEHPEFQERYIETVSYRIMYTINKSGNGKINLRELKRSDLIDTLFELDAEMDINRVLRYFSYEHFYVIYCKFWELDTDHDFLLEKHDLLRYGSHCLTYQIVERIFDIRISLKEGPEEGRMDYRDFVWFILSEEDKMTDASLEYWFGCVDLDCDGFLSSYDMRPFYDAQVERMENTSCESILFEDVFCQLHDLIQPQYEGYFSIQDLRKHRGSPSILFNTLFNLHKFLLYEHRDPFTMRAEQECVLTDWDKFAAQEYDILAAEEDQEGSIRDESNALAGEIQDGY